MKKKQKLTLAILLIIGAFIVFGLYYYNAVRNLKFQLYNVGLLDVGLTSASVQISIKVENPSLLPVYVSSMSFELLVNEQRLAYSHLGGFTVGGNGQRIVTTSVTFSYLDVGMSIASLITNHDVVTVKVVGSASVFLISVDFATILYHAEFD